MATFRNRLADLASRARSVIERTLFLFVLSIAVPLWFSDGDAMIVIGGVILGALLTVLALVTTTNLSTGSRFVWGAIVIVAIAADGAFVNWHKHPEAWPFRTELTLPATPFASPPDTKLVSVKIISHLMQVSPVQPHAMTIFAAMGYLPNQKYVLHPISNLIYVELTGENPKPVSAAGYTIQGYNGDWKDVCTVHFVELNLVNVQNDRNPKSLLVFELPSQNMDAALSSTAIEYGHSIKAFVAIWCPETRGVCSYGKLRMHIRDTLGGDLYAELHNVASSNMTQLERGALIVGRKHHIPATATTFDYTCPEVH